MVSLTGFKRSFTPKWQMCLFACAAMFLFVSLGCWQIARAHQKQHMLTEKERSVMRQPIDWATHHALPKQYQRVKIKGQLLKEVFLLDNQHHAHQFGYDVLSPVLVGDGHVVLVDRGWLAGDPLRQSFPMIEPMQDGVELQGHAYYPSKNSWVLGDVLEEKRKNLVIVEAIDIPIISHFLHKAVDPFIIRLDQDEQTNYIRQWATVSMPPVRHFAYAVQWFAMALVVLILFITLNMKKHDEKD